MPKGIYKRKNGIWPSVPRSEEWKEKVRAKNSDGRCVWNLGKKASLATRKKISMGIKKHLPKTAFKKGMIKSPLAYSFQKSKNHWNWQGGKTAESDKIKNSPEYKLWRETIFKRDNYTCQLCGKRGGLNADHIKPKCLFPELIFDINNGRTLCKDCHKKTDTYALKPKSIKGISFIKENYIYA